MARLAVDRIPTVNTHGTGCTLFGGCRRSRKGSVAEAVREGKAYVTAAIAASKAPYRSWFWPDASFPRVVVISFRDRSQGMRRKVASHSSGSTTFG